jgi:hypothetical protein
MRILKPDLLNRVKIPEWFLVYLVFANFFYDKKEGEFLIIPAMHVITIPPG